ncbi:hypothetical protein N3K66_001947 [Trichothecium roseum]|uniref:Uncharacterized protein n=1 Tax=Trichothecium roseum TaxID=47278 RepID=A0ACC0V9U0_9HYPO|nr:hypothetical protein N3K66_001947 [Trichothecium roseum]
MGAPVYRMRLASLLLALCAVSVANAAPEPVASPTADASESTSASPTVTEAPIFLPHWSDQTWSLVRGSIIESNATASETTYTIFCPEQTPPACDISLDFPFIVVGGPHTVRFHGTVTETFIANVECELNNSTAATCSGYSSLKSGYTKGVYTGETEISWTSTLKGTDAQWGTLTMDEPPSTTAEILDMTATSRSFPDDGDDETVDLNVTRSGATAGQGNRSGSVWVAAATLVTAILTHHLL